MSKAHLTAKQAELLTVIAKGNGEEPADLDEILERIRYETTKASLQFSIRALIKHGFIEKAGTEKRRGRQRVVIKATELGRQMVQVGAASSQSIIETDEDSLIAELLE